MSGEHNIIVSCSFYASALILALSIILDCASSEDALHCNKCVDNEGNSCDDVVRRFGNTKYWVIHEEKDALRTFEDALATCRKYGFILPEINSEADQATFRQLIQYAGLGQYWLGAVSQKSSKGHWTAIDLASPMVWRPRKVLKDFFGGGNSGGLLAASMDALGVWRTGPGAGRKLGTACQFPWTTHCYEGNKFLVGRSLSGSDAIPDPGADSCPWPQHRDSRFIQTGPNSKYLYPEKPFFVPIGDAYKICWALGLEPATVETTQDHYHLVEEFIKPKELDKLSSVFDVAIGIVDSAAECYFENINTRNLARLQLFNLKSQFYYEDLLDCGTLQTWEKASEEERSYVYMKSHDCEVWNAMPLCQYRRETDCYMKSPLGKLEVQQYKLKGSASTIAQTPERTYFGNPIQRTFNEARSFCSKFGYKVLSLTKADPSETKFIGEVVLPEFMRIFTIPDFAGISWTSGKFETSYDKDESFTFETTGETWKYDDNVGHFEWIPDELVVNPSAERCLVAVKGNEEKLRLRPVVCHLKNFVICYEDHTTVETTTLQPKTTLPPTETQGASERCPGVDLKVTFSNEGFTGEQVSEIIKDSITLGFAKNYSDRLNIKEESQWRVPHVKAMGALTKTLCAADAVPPEFINILMNLIMIYYNNMDEIPRDTHSEAHWRETEKKYKECMEILEPLSFELRGGLATYFYSKSENGTIEIDDEVVDTLPALDIVLEGLWFMFEATAAVCYGAVDSKTEWMANFFFHFRNDFTEQFKEWWTDPGVTNFGLLFGDIDLYESMYNLRACSVAIFYHVDIEDRMFVRPVNADDTNFITKDLNQRVDSGRIG